jgi:hypothetical protein
VAQRVEEFVAFHHDIDQKIEYLELLRPAMVPLVPKAEFSGSVCQDCV